MALALLATVTVDAYGPVDAPAYGLAGFIGLGGGLMVGAVAAANSEVSLERVRVTTLGGYGGALVGGIVGINTGGDEGVSGGTAIGAAAGLVLTFLLASGFDDTDAVLGSTTPAIAPQAATPTLMSVMDRSGRLLPALGLELAGF
jgi:hypothetical protein